MRRILSIVLVLSMILALAPTGLFAITASAETTSGYYTYTVSNGEATITDCDTSISGEIIIPSMLGGFPVTSIGDSAFDRCTKLTSITIPDSVTSIGNYAFYCCGIKYVTIGSGVTSIGDNAFMYCENILNIIIPDNVISIGNNAFERCRNLTRVFIGSGVTSIGEEAFIHCYGLSLIGVVEDNKYYSNDEYGSLFNKNKTTLIQASRGKWRIYGIPNSVTRIGDYAFYECSSLFEINIPNSVTSIGDHAFADCTGLRYVNFDGSYEARKKINIERYNDPLYNAKWTYAPCQTHKYDHACDPQCDICGTTREITHIYTNNCDKTCNNCDFTRDSDHLYDTKCDTTCNNCGEIRTITHTYDDDCDTICNVCGSARVVQHNYEWVIDQNETCGKNGIKHEECTLCRLIQNADTVIPATGNHIYENAYDTECDVCGYIRTIYTITYDLNKGTGVFEPLPKEHGVDIALPTEQPVRDGYHFAGWSTTKNGDIEYEAGGICSLNQSVILYAQWDLHCTSCYGSGTVEQNKSCTNCGGDGKYQSYCGTCSGAGYVGYVTEKDYCFSCSGSGEIKDYIICSLCNGNRCSACGYDGFSYGPVTKACSKCGGSGQISTQVPLKCIDCGGDGDWQERTCGVCDGDGKEIVHKTCTHCNGTGNYNRVSVSAPNAPVVDNKTATSIALKAIENGEYSIDGINWQESPIFENLETGKEYSFYQRYAKTDTTYISEISIALVAIPEQLYIPGDLTGDDKINSLDGLLLMRYLNGWNVNIASPEAMDVNGDGKVNSLDCLILMRYLNGWNVTLG